MSLSALLSIALIPVWGANADLPLNFVRAPGPVVVDGRLDDWVLTAPVSYEVDPAAQDRSVCTYAMWDDRNLYLAYVVRDASPMKNSGDDPSRAFKTGDSLHFYLSTSELVEAAVSDGGPQDYHVLMSVLQDRPVVFAFRQQKAGVTTPTVISSPATRIEMAWMGPVPDAALAVEISPDKRGYTAEVSLPLAFFDDFRPQAGQTVAADVAVNFSDDAGAANLAKVWWHRGSSQILDVPSELRFERHLWGRAVFRAAGETPLVINNQNFYVVPAPGPVTIDGDLGDWDLSCAYGPQYVDPALQDQYNATWAMMYDDQALYLGAIFNTGVPYNNEHGVDNTWWLGDSLEFRLQADTKWRGGDPRENPDILTFALWYNPKEDKDYLALQRSFKFETGDISMGQVKSRATPGGRTFEARIPWSVVKSGNHPRAGDSVQCTLAAIWQNGLRAFAMGSISSFRGMGDWGLAHFLATGKQALVFRDLRQPTAVEAPLNAGQYKALVQVPEKSLLSAGVYDAQGRLLRTLFAGREVEAGPAEIGWDGKDDLGQPVPPGEYEIRAVSNAGLHARYVTSACSPGKPPHASPDPRRGWGGVWGNVIDLAADASGIYPLWAMEEGDGALLHTDEDGNLLWRQHLPLALPGPQVAIATNGKYVFVAVDVKSSQGRRAGLWRVNCADGSYAPFAHEGADPLEFYLEGVEVPEEAETGDIPAVTGLAADERTLYVSCYHQNRVALFDAESGQLRRTFPVPRPRGLCLDGRGGLAVISGVRIVSLDPATGRREPLVSLGLDEPYRVAVDKQGNLVVTDRGASQQVKRFSREGKLLGVFGKPGGRDNNGKFEVDRLRNPAGIAVAASGKVFYSEDAPPRIFVRLSADLKYEKLWAGPWYISGEVCVDPEIPEHLYMWSHEAFIRHVIDYEHKTSRPDAVWSDFALPPGQYGRWFPRIVHHGGYKYMFCGGNPDTLYRIDGDRVLLIAAVGTDRSNREAPLWAFSDLNENGRMDEGERVTFKPAPEQPVFGGSYFGGDVDERDMSLYLLSWGAQEAVFVLSPEWAKPGVPVYSFDRARVIPLAAAHKPGKRAGFSSIWHAPDGGVFGNADVQGSDPRGIGHSSHLSDVFVYRLDPEGNLVWRAGKKASGLAKHGEFYGRACGLGGPIGEEYFSFVDEGGQDRVYTQDGLYVGSLLEDPAVAPPSEYTLLVEHFNSNVFRNARDGKWYFVAGASGYASIWEIAGLEKVKRLSAKVTVG